MGSAFGLVTAIQNIGLVIAPTLVGYIKDQTKHIDHGYHYVMMFFVASNLVGFVLNMSLYTIDIYHNGGVLDKVDQGTPLPKKKQLPQEPQETSDGLLDH